MLACWKWETVQRKDICVQLSGEDFEKRKNKAAGILRATLARML